MKVSWVWIDFEFRDRRYSTAPLLSRATSSRRRGAGHFIVRVTFAIAALTCLVSLRGEARELHPDDRDLDQHALFRVVGAMYGLDPELLEAVARVESGGNPYAVSPKGAIGLMQLMPATAARYRVHNPHDPVENALGAARYLSHLKEAIGKGDGEVNSDLSRILAAYNAGEGAVLRYDGIPPYRETQGYVARVLWFYLLGVPPPLRQRDLAATSALKSTGRIHQGDRAVLEELDSLRRSRDRASAVTAPPPGHDRRD